MNQKPPTNLASLLEGLLMLSIRLFICFGIFTLHQQLPHQYPHLLNSTTYPLRSLAEDPVPEPVKAVVKPIDTNGDGIVEPRIVVESVDQLEEALTVIRKINFNDPNHPQFAALKKFLNEAFSDLLIVPPELVAKFDFPEKSLSLSETQLTYLYFLFPEFKAALAKFFKLVDAGKAETPEYEEFKTVEKAALKLALDTLSDKKRDLLMLNDPSKALVVELKGQKAAVEDVSITFNHPLMDEDGKIYKESGNLKKLLIDFIDSIPKGDSIMGNFFELDLIEVAEAIIRAQERGVKVVIGVDINTTELKPQNQAARDLLLAHEKSVAKPDFFQVALVDPTGLNHQKIIATNSKTLLLSGNPTQSCLGPEGDAKEVLLSLRPARSIPNANHAVIVEGSLFALVAKNNLTHTLLEGLRGQRQYPIGGQWAFVGEMDPILNQPILARLLFSPNGAGGDINKWLLAPLVKSAGGSVHLGQFAMSSPVVIDALKEMIMEHAKAGTLDFSYSGDPSFSLRPWAAAVALSGMIEDPSTGELVLDKESEYVKALTPEQLKKVQEEIRINRGRFGEFHFKIKDEKGILQNVKISVKYHHKVILLKLKGISVVGTSQNVSLAAEGNTEQVFIIRHSGIAKDLAGALRYHGRSGTTMPVVKAADIRNKAKRLFGQDPFNPTDRDLSPEEKAELETGRKEQLKKVKLLSKRLSTPIISVFDIDATLLFLPTPIYMIHKDTKVVLAITPKMFDGGFRAENPKFRMITPADNAVYIDPSDPTKTQIKLSDSFAAYTSIDENGNVQNKFSEQIEALIKGGRAAIKLAEAPAFMYFVQRLATQELANNAFINTAREHSADDIYLGLEKIQAYLASRGTEIFLPPRENYYRVSGEARERGLTNEAVKAEKNIALIEALQVLKEPKVFEFWDDSVKNYESTVKAVLLRGKDFPNVKVVLGYVGTETKGRSPHVVVIENGTIRLATSLEMKHYAQFGKGNVLLESMSKPEILTTEPVLKWTTESLLAERQANVARKKPHAEPRPVAPLVPKPSGKCHEIFGRLLAA